jgi:hypothetical protein
VQRNVRCVSIPGFGKSALDVSVTANVVGLIRVPACMLERYACGIVVSGQQPDAGG